LNIGRIFDIKLTLTLTDLSFYDKAMCRREYILIIVLILFLFGCAPSSTGLTNSSNLGGLAVSQSSLTMHHTVVRGDTLYRIAQRYGVSAREICRINKISDIDSIEVGQRLVIPTKGKSVSTAAPKKKFQWPTKGYVAVSFGETDAGTVSKGIGIRASLGSKVKAAQSGTVTFVGDKVKGYGKVIVLDHGDGFETVYAHNSENLVQLGEKVRRGQQIALVGRGGRASFPCLYFELRWRHQPLDPLAYLE